MIVVAGASGWTGRTVLAALAANGLEAAAISHSATGAKRLTAAGVTDVRRADMGDRQSLVEVLRGADTVYVIPPALHQAEDELAENVVTAAADAGVRHVIYHSVMHPYTPDLRNHLRKARCEYAVRCSGLEWTILQPSLFAQVALVLFGSDGGPEVRSPFDIDQPMAVIDLEDLASVVVKVVTEDGHAGATYEMAGPHTTVREMVGVLADIRGVALEAKQVPVVESPLVPAAAATPMATADMISTFAHYDAHGFVGNTRILEMLLQRPATPFADVAARELAFTP